MADTSKYHGSRDAQLQCVQMPEVTREKVYKEQRLPFWEHKQFTDIRKSSAYKGVWHMESHSSYTLEEWINSNKNLKNMTYLLLHKTITQCPGSAEDKNAGGLVQNY